MTAHTLSWDDRRFKANVKACRISPGAFNHRAHIRLAYIYLVEHPDEVAYNRFRRTLQALLQHHGVPESKYHETITRAWILAVHYFMEQSSPALSADAFLEENPILLDSDIMMTHYSEEVLFSEAARRQFVEPDLAAIPRHQQ